MSPTIYHVKPEQVGSEELQEFLRKQIRNQFEGKDYYIAKELIEEKITPYSPKSPRKLRGFLINESNSIGHAIWFDVTACSTGANWYGR